MGDTPRMTVSVAKYIGMPIASLISKETGVELSERDAYVLNFCQGMSTELYNGYVDGDFVCCWGLVAPTVFSTQAYLWMYASDAVAKHQFLFVRRSQIIVEDMLTRYDSLTGHCVCAARSSRRWLRWLGAEFGPPQGDIVPFTIRRRLRG